MNVSFAISRQVAPAIIVESRSALTVPLTVRADTGMTAARSAGNKIEKRVIIDLIGSKHRLAMRIVDE